MRLIYGLRCHAWIRQFLETIDMPTRNVDLSDHQASLLKYLVTSGRYQNVSEVLQDGLRLVERSEAAWIGIDDIETGAFRSFDSAAVRGQHLSARALEVTCA